MKIDSELLYISPHRADQARRVADYADDGSLERKNVSQRNVSRTREMAFIHEGSCECTKSELDLFSVPLTQTSIKSGTFVELTDGAPIEFDVTSCKDDYIDFANSYLHIKAKIERANGANLEAADTVGPVNNLLHSLFSQVDVSLNGTLITRSSNAYPYRANLENLLSYGLAAKSSQLTSELFYKVEDGKMDKPNPLEANADERNTGLARRAGFIARSREVDLVGRIHTDIFFQNLYMLNEVNTK